MKKSIYIKTLLFLCFITLLSACKAHIDEEKGPRQDQFPRIENSRQVLFIHGMYLTPLAWQQWQQYFEANGYETLAPAWPLHESSVEQQNDLHPSPELGELSLNQIIDHYRGILSELEEKPIAVGHSMGGLITQILLQENLIAAGIAIDSAPPFGVLTLEAKFLKANWPMLNPIYSAADPIKLTFKQFQYGFTNNMELDDQQQAYATYIVPESRRVGRATTTTASRIDSTVARGPLLLISGGEDRTITASLNHLNFERYKNSPAITDYKQFPERNHWTIQQDGWEHVADYSLKWISENR